MKEYESQQLTRRDFLKMMVVGASVPFLNSFEKSFQLESTENHLEEKEISLLLKESLTIPNPIDTPTSLMLHSANEAQIATLAPYLAERYSSYTYREFYALLAKGHDFSNGKPPLLLSIDDPASSWLNPAYKRMIDSMSKYGLVGTLGVVTTGEQKDVPQEVSAYFKETQEMGWEIAVHTEGHLMLPSLANDQIEYEITECYQNIGDATGIYPSTLILPFGLVSALNMLDQPDKYNQQIFSVCRNLNIRFIAGIPYGKTFQGKPPYFVGRIPPHKSDFQTTLSWLENSFIQSGPRKIVRSGQQKTSR